MITMAELIKYLEPALDEIEDKVDAALIKELERDPLLNNKKICIPVSVVTLDKLNAVYGRYQKEGWSVQNTGTYYQFTHELMFSDIPRKASKQDSTTLLQTINNTQRAIKVEN